MARDFTLRATIKGEDQLSPAARSAQSATQQLVSEMERLGIEADAAGRIVEEFAKGLEEGAKQAARTGDAVESAGDQVNRSNDFFDRFVNEIRSRFVITAGDAANAVLALAGALGSTVDAAAESDQALRGVANALSDLDPAAAFELTDALRQQSSVLQQTTAFSGDAILRGQALAASFVKTRTELEALTQAAVDLAAGRGIDLGTAFQALTRASQGSVEALERYGIVIDETTPKGEQFAAVLARVNELFGGRAVADAQTYAGAISRVGSAFTELQAALGRSVTESGAVRQTLNDVTDLLNASADAATEARTGQDTFAASISRATDFLVRATGPLANIVVNLREMQEARAAATALEALAEQASRLAVNAAGLERVGALVRAMGEEATRSQGPLELFLLQMENLRIETERLAQARERFEATSATFGTGLSAAEKPVLDFDAALSDLEAQFDSGVISLREFLAEYDALKLSFETGSTAAERAAAAAQTQGAAASAAAAGLRDAAAANREFGDEVGAGGEALAGSTQGIDRYVEAIDGRLIPALQRAGDQASATAAQVSGVFDRAGNELPAGGTLSLGGTRYDLPGGGSRLVGAAGGVRNSASNLGVNYQRGGVGGGAVGSPYSNRFLIDTPQYGTIEAFKVSSYGFGPSGAGTSTYGVLPGGRIVQLN